jgi:hypothetical protein
VQELTAKLVDRLADEGIDTEFPYHALRAREGPAGVSIWSRYPLQRGRDDAKPTDANTSGSHDDADDVSLSGRKSRKVADTSTNSTTQGRITSNSPPTPP